MSPIFMRWTPEMSVGSDELDEDHKQLFYLINLLASYPEAEVPPEAVRKALFSLLRYAALHFRREEMVMAACGYPELEGHQDQHKAFVDKIEGIIRRFDEDPKNPDKHVSDDLLAYLKDWLTHHILLQDMSYKTCILENAAAAERAARSLKGVEIGWTG